ncbi:flagellar hook-basal body complex protein [Arcobacter sp. FWKO B]|uniref:flagellar hook-basal body complex protein n=1 Tax=Arcobacter sp. FWKO B TaxID=2593672 RepID=UPI0018A4F80B|nr:flagellar hook-basal body complex protein [Arcobacter sp. FWKO B]QOG12019.1 flagellar hook-basal body complex protein [Arcobacter sp. FWKO B]
MIGALYNGISGLTAFQKALNTESNNIANVNTAGYKADNVTFADMLYQNGGVGMGSTIQSVQKSFTQGNLKVTGNPYDMAVDGKGFFMVQGNREEIYFTRAGDFRMGTDGTLQTAGGMNVMGFVTSPTPQITATNPLSTQFNSDFSKYLGSQVVFENDKTITFNARATDYVASSYTDPSTQSGDGYKTAGIKVSDIEALAADYRQKLSELAPVLIEPGTPSTTQLSSVMFSDYSSKVASSSDYMEIFVGNNVLRQIFDTDAQTTLKKLSDQISSIKGLTSSVDVTTGELRVESLIPGQKVVVGSAKINDDDYLVNTTDATKGNGIAAVESSKVALQAAVERAGAEFLEIVNMVDYSNAAALQVDKIQLKLDNIGVSDNGFGTPEVVNGVILMNQNGHSFVVGKVSTAYFNDLHSLNPIGDNLYGKTLASGEPIYAGDLNSVKNNLLEMSNAELGSSLTNLMVYQRAFEANSKAITTSDEFLNIAIQLKK